MFENYKDYFFNDKINKIATKRPSCDVHRRSP